MRAQDDNHFCHPDSEPFASCHSEGEKRVLNEVKELKLLRFTQDELRISLRAGSVKGKGLQVVGEITVRV